MPSLPDTNDSLIREIAVNVGKIQMWLSSHEERDTDRHAELKESHTALRKDIATLHTWRESSNNLHAEATGAHRVAMIVEEQKKLAIAKRRERIMSVVMLLVGACVSICATVFLRLIGLSK